MARIPLEDNFGDIVGKAQRGLRLTDAELARRAGMSVERLRALKSVSPAVRDNSALLGLLRPLAVALHLGEDALVASATAAWRPRDVEPLDGLGVFTTPFEDMMVNAYVVFDSQTRQAAAFDTGADADPMLQFIREKQLTLVLILLTHTHTDHVFELDRLKDATGAKAYASEREPLPGAEPFADGKEFTLGGLRIETRRTSGHARGGTTFVVTGLARRLAMVGDALFAGSMGGGLVSYDEALRTNRTGIFTLPDDTIICPGHGPLTTVGEEKRHNPFFPEFQVQQGAQQQ
ncbi:MAG: MBL fold metallo-hydrolase [Verrucomicrobiia bacterium]|jgi:glyoxylase-like metal-dependent hydrolase (beta-lactamase superfamily II)